VFACGVSLSDKIVAAKWLKGLPRVPIMFHLNDSHEPLGSGRDVHARLTHGHIWNRNKSGLLTILKYAKKHKSIIILERDRESAISDIKLIQKLVV
jgi:endonuclease IV